MTDGGAKRFAYILLNIVRSIIAVMLVCSGVCYMFLREESIETALLLIGIGVGLVIPSMKTPDEGQVLPTVNDLVSQRRTG